MLFIAPRVSGLTFMMTEARTPIATKVDVSLFAGQDGGISKHTINQMLVPAHESIDAEDAIQCLKQLPDN